MMNTVSEDLANFTTLPSHADTFKNCTDEEFLQIKSYLSVLYSIIFLVCFPANVIVIFTYIFKMRPWKSSTIVMLNLAVTDLLYLATLPFLIHYSANGDNWIFGVFMCKFIRFNFYINLYSSIFFLTCFSIFRYIVVIYPMSCFFVWKRRWAVVACTAVWVISLVAASPLNFLITSKENQNRSICMDLTTSEDLETSRWYNWLLTVFAFLPLLIVTLCYIVIIYTLATGPHTHTLYKQKARKLAILLLVVFYFCFLPFHVLRGTQIELRLHPVSCVTENQTYALFIVSMPLAALNTLGNLLLYVVLGDNFQQAILSLLKLKTNKSTK
ncbi:WD repeat-containing protein 35 [Platysternon megacephalum]|uniref:WD repeat-containing protein 35 n=1 Tax=Platysternon megacephalum TaxID=55544 RepID=A0A4D9FAB9_9SAUR|nr:WD repeat-containing protein 35 [Platysternon megacephalum]